MPNNLRYPISHAEPYFAGHQHRYARQAGFTLLELMISMAIFAVLAVVGWQVFDTISQSKARADLQTDTLTELQYGYQQIQRDLMQVVAYQQPSSVNSVGAQVSDGTVNNNPVGALTGSPSIDSTAIDSTADSSGPPSFSLQANELSFIRYADPDPRYMQSDHLERIVYSFDDGNLLRHRYATLQSNSNEKPLSSVVISGINAGDIQVLLPAPSSSYPNEDGASNEIAPLLDISGSTDLPSRLPRGVSVSFSVMLGNVDTPVSWTYALQQTVAKPKSKTSDTGQNKDQNKTQNTGTGSGATSGAISSTAKQSS